MDMRKKRNVAIRVIDCPEGVTQQSCSNCLRMNKKKAQHGKHLWSCAQREGHNPNLVGMLLSHRLKMQRYSERGIKDMHQTRRGEALLLRHKHVNTR